MSPQITIDGPSHRSARQRLIRVAGAALFCSLAVAVAACGGSTATSSSTTTPGGGGTATPAGATSAAATPTPAATTLSCPSSSAVGSALGITGVPAPTTIGTSASGVSCNYLSTATPVFDVVVSIVNGIPSSYLSTAEASMNATASAAGLSFTAVSGVGDEAYSYSYSLGGSESAAGIIAVKGTTFVGIACTGTSATLPVIEAYARTLLG
jgi:hypothetical protein